MNTYLKILVVIFSILCSFPLKAQNSTTQSNSSRTPIYSATTTLIPDVLVPNPNNRPKYPSLQQVECIYEDGYISILFATPEGACNIAITDRVLGRTVYSSFNSYDEYTQIYFGVAYDLYIEVSTAYGNVYVGDMN